MDLESIIHCHKWKNKNKNMESQIVQMKNGLSVIVIRGLSILFIGLFTAS